MRSVLTQPSPLGGPLHTSRHSRESLLCPVAHFYGPFTLVGETRWQLSQGERSGLTMRQCVERCVKASTADEEVPARALPALLMHHLLWRVNQCDGLERREPLRRALLQWTDDFAATPDAFLGELV